MKRVKKSRRLDCARTEFEMQPIPADLGAWLHWNPRRQPFGRTQVVNRLRHTLTNYDELRTRYGLNDKPLAALRRHANTRIRAALAEWEAEHGAHFVGMIVDDATKMALREEK